MTTFFHVAGATGDELRVVYVGIHGRRLSNGLKGTEDGLDGL